MSGWDRKAENRKSMQSKIERVLPYLHALLDDIDRSEGYASNGLGVTPCEHVSKYAISCWHQLLTSLVCHGSISLLQALLIVLYQTLCKTPIGLQTLQPVYQDFACRHASRTQLFGMGNHYLLKGT